VTVCVNPPGARCCRLQLQPSRLRCYRLPWVERGRAGRITAAPAPGAGLSLWGRVRGGSPTLRVRAGAEGSDRGADAWPGLVPAFPGPARGDLILQRVPHRFARAGQPRPELQSRPSGDLAGHFARSLPSASFCSARPFLRGPWAIFRSHCVLRRAAAGDRLNMGAAATTVASTVRHTGRRPLPTPFQPTMITPFPIGVYSG